SGAKADLVGSDILDNGTGIFTNGVAPDPFSPEGGLNLGATEVRISGGNIIGNSFAWSMNDPGLTSRNDGSNNATIYLDANGDGPNFPNVVGNGGFSVTGNGSSCNNNPTILCFPNAGYTFGYSNANLQ